MDILPNRRSFLRESLGLVSGAAVGAAGLGVPFATWRGEASREALVEEYRAINETRAKNNTADQEEFSAKPNPEERIESLQEAENDSRAWWGKPAAIFGGVLGASAGVKAAQRHTQIQNTIRTYATARHIGC